MAILITDRVEFKTKSVTRDKEGHFTMEKRTNNQEEIIILRR